MRVFCVVVGVCVVSVGGCYSVDDDDDDDGVGEGEGEDGAEGEGDSGFVGDCPDVGAGLTLEETAAFSPDEAGDGVVVVMGGGVEVDRAAVRFVEGARGGDVLVLRATGSTSSYTAYFDGSSGELPAFSVPPRAVATVRVDDAAAGDDPGLLCRVAYADAVWLAGGDQSDYLVAWPAALHAALRAAVARGVAVGGTSAGAMALSEFSYDARDGGVSSDEAVAAPAATSVSASPFFAPALSGRLVDTHFRARDRERRLLAFVAHAQDEFDVLVRGLGIDEEAAVVFDDDGARVLADGDGGVFTYAIAGSNVDGALDIDVVSRAGFFDGDVIDDGVDDEFAVVDGVLQ